MEGVEIDLGRTAVRKDGKPVAIAPREFALVAALAVLRDGVSRKRLIEMFWPGNQRDGITSLKVTIYRLRKLLGEDVVVTDGTLYRLNESVHVDFWRVEDFLSASGTSRPSVPIGDAIEAWQRLCGRTCYHAEDKVLANAITRLCQQAGQRIARHALEVGDYEAALRAAHVMIDRDPLDEPAREVAIRANLAKDDAAAALRELREYETFASRHGKSHRSSELFSLVSQRILGEA